MKHLLAMILLLAALSGQLCFGQASAINGQIEGTVLDPAGAAVSGATVGGTNVSTGYTQKGETSNSGFYRFSVLPLGTYEVTVESAGFAPVKRTGIVLTAGYTAVIDIGLQVKGSATEVVVTSDAPITEPGRIDLGNTLNYNFTNNLPLVSRKPYNFILLQPNVSGHPNTEFGVVCKIDASKPSTRMG